MFFINVPIGVLGIALTMVFMQNTRDDEATLPPVLTHRRVQREQKTRLARYDK
jgi:hypothetical protein